MSLTVQLYTMLSMIGMGAWVGAALDTYQRFLNRPKRKRWIVFIYDLLFWAVQALFIFYVLLLVNEAELRFYVFIALLCGFAAYQSLLKKLYVNLLERMIRFTIQTYRFFMALLHNLIVKPIIYLVQLLIAIILFLLRILQAIGLGIYRIAIRILLIAWKIVFIPVRFIGILIWKLLPNRVKIFIRRYAGFLGKIKKLKVNMVKMWKNIKQRLGGPRK
ncbi:MAG: spore cortex biosynthesis protein YabQ [Ectobacillus sp.]